MCDTMVALAPLTRDGLTLFAKNSDREPNEAQYLTRVPAADHAPGETLRASYVEIPQVPHTHALIGSRPWWMWGFEHGVNEHGLAIGNEAVWSRLPAGREPGLLGMDLLRLTLERAASADEGLAVLTALVERYGQSGRAAVARDHFYHNAFILADAASGWVLETAGRHWVAKRVRGWASISNLYSIGSDYDRISAGAEAFATEQGWHRAGTRFDWAASFNDTERANFPTCQARLQMSRAGMVGLVAAQPVTVADMFARLRDHGEECPHPGAGGQGRVCMHAVSAHQGSETAAAMVAELSADGPPVLWCAPGSPCLSAFVPVWIDAGVPEGWAQPAPAAPDIWWQTERMQRLAERDYARFAPRVRAALDPVEARGLAAVAALPLRAPASARGALTRALGADHAAALAALTVMLEGVTAGSEDPRGAYLAEVSSDIPDTARPAA